MSADSKKSESQGEPVSGTVAKDKRAATYTVNAREGFNTSEVVNAAFAKRSFGSSTPRRLEVVEPDGPSTAGGKRARQTIRLVPREGNAPPLMCGSLDASQRAVELRSYGALCAQYEERFRQPLDISAEEYTRLAKDLQATLSFFKYTFTVEQVDERPRAVGASMQPPRASRLNVVLFGAVALIVAGVALAMIMR